MKKRVLSVLLALCLLCGLAPMGPRASAEEIKGLCGLGLHYVIDTEARTLTISGTGELGASAPWRSHSDVIDKVVIEPGITAIGGEGLFAGMGFSQIELPDTLTKIGTTAFQGSSSFEHIEFPDSLTELGFKSFAGCGKLRSVELPEGVTEVAGHAFSNCDSLTSVKLPSTIKHIRDWAFRSCDALKEINLAEGLESIGDEAFAGTALERVVIPASVASMSPGVFSGCGSLKTVVMLGGGTELPRETFLHCGSLEHIKLPDNLKTVAYNSFKGCGSLGRLDFPMTVASIRTPFTTFDQTYPNLKTVVIPNPDCEMGSERWPGSLGMPGTTTLYATSPSIIDYAIAYGYDVQDPGSEPEDDWDPFAEPTPEPTETPDPVETPTPKPTETPDPAETPTPDPTETPDPAETPTPAPQKFDDVKPSDWFYDAVQWALQNGITSGASVNRFGSKMICDRSQAVFFLWAASGKPEPESLENPFDDVSTSAYYYKAVLWAVENNITGGTNQAGTTFSPTMDCSRGQIVTFLYAAKGRPTPPRFNRFNDIKTGAYYEKPANWAAQQGITTGTNQAGTQFSPNKKCTRSEIVTFLYNAYQ